MPAKETGCRRSAGMAWGVYSLRGKAAGDPTRFTTGNFLRSIPFAVLLNSLMFETSRPDPCAARDQKPHCRIGDDAGIGRRAVSDDNATSICRCEIDAIITTAPATNQPQAWQHCKQCLASDHRATRDQYADTDKTSAGVLSGNGLPTSRTSVYRSLRMPIRRCGKGVFRRILTSCFIMHPGLASFLNQPEFFNHATH